MLHVSISLRGGRPYVDYQTNSITSLINMNEYIILTDHCHSITTEALSDFLLKKLKFALKHAFEI